MFPGWEPRRFRRKDDGGGYSMHKDLERRASMLHTRVNPSPRTPLPPRPAILQPSSKETARKGPDPTSEGCGERRTPQDSAL